MLFVPRVDKKVFCVFPQKVDMFDPIAYSLVFPLQSVICTKSCFQGLWFWVMIHEFFCTEKPLGKAHVWWTSPGRKSSLLEIWATFLQSRVVNLACLHTIWDIQPQFGTPCTKEFFSEEKETVVCLWLDGYVRYNLKNDNLVKLLKKSRWWEVLFLLKCSVFQEGERAELDRTRKR